MSKTEIVTELQTILNDLKGITADLEQNISGLKDFLEDRKFIPKELGASIREQLEAIDAKQTEIVSKYEMLDVQKPEMQHTAIEENLSEIQKVIEENEKYRKAIAFFWNFMPMMKNSGDTSESKGQDCSRSDSVDGGGYFKGVCRTICMAAAGVLGEGRKKKILADL